MFVKFDIFNNKKQFVGTSAVSFDWKAHAWLVTEDKTGAWNNVAANRSGKFELKDWSVIWMWDQLKNIAIIWDPPKNGTDLTALKGSARLYDPLNSSSFKDAIANWTIDPGSAGKVSMVMHVPLPFTRNAYVQRVDMLMPAPYMSLNNDLLTNKLRKTDKVVAATPHYTTCGSLPGFVTQQVALSKGLKGQAVTDWVNKFSLNGTNRVRSLGNQYHCWEESAPNKRPKPGDIYALLDRDKTDKANAGISHVGMIADASGSNWTTMDLGQGGGFDGCKNTRPYKADTCEIWGENNQGGGYRTVAGWVDLEKYFKL